MKNLKKCLEREYKEIGLFLSKRCNYNCPYCSTNMNISKKELDNEDYKKILDSCKDLGVKCIIICGAGEPLLDQNLFEIIKIARSYGISVNITTNGYYLERKTIEFLYENRVSLCVKLHSLNEERYLQLSRIRKGPKWVNYNYSNKIIKLPSFLVDLLKSNYFTRSNKDEFYFPPICIETVITRINYYEIPALANLAKLLKIQFFVEPLILINNAELNKKDLVVSENKLNKLFYRLLWIQGLNFFLGEVFHKCMMQKNFLITNYGDVSNCITALRTFGNIKDDPLKDILRRMKPPKFHCHLGFRRCPTRYYIYNELKKN